MPLDLASGPPPRTAPPLTGSFNVYVYYRRASCCCRSRISAKATWAGAWSSPRPPANGAACPGRDPACYLRLAREAGWTVAVPAAHEDPFRSPEGNELRVVDELDVTAL